MPARGALRLAAFTGALLQAIASLAQNVLPTGNVYGRVMDEQAAALSGVTASLQGAGARQPTTTDAGGHFRFLYLAPGTYAISLAMQGFATVDYQKITVVVGRDTELSVTMKVSPVAETVTVSGAAPALDSRNTSTGLTFDKTDLQEIPMARDPWALLWQVPGVVPNQVNVSGNTSVQQAVPVSKGVEGISYVLDGVNITQGGGSPTYYNFDSFQEVQVTTGGSELRLSGGVTMNLVTRRGTNQLHGSGHYYYLGNRWQANNTPAEASEQNFDSDKTDLIRDYGLDIGGPVLKDRLWFWGAWAQSDINLQKIGQVLDNGQPVRENSAFQHWNAKLNAQISTQNALTLFYQHDDKTQLGRGAGPFVAQEASLDQRSHVPVYKIEDSHVFSSSLLATIFYSYLPVRFGFTPEGGLGPQAYFDANGVQRGSNVQVRNSNPQRQIAGGASYFFNTGKLGHELKFGFGYKTVNSSSQSIWPGDQIFGNEQSQLAGITREGNLKYRTQTYGGFIGDTLTADRLTVNAGLRYDYGRAKNLPSTAGANPTFPEILPAINYPGDAGYPISHGSLQPRVGATYALGAARRSLLRASYARFADLALDNVTTNNPIPVAQYIYYYWTDSNHNNHVDRDEVDTASGNLGFYGVDPNNPGSTVSPNTIRPNLRPSTIDEALVGVEQEIFPGLVASLVYTHRWIHDVVFKPPTGVAAGGGGYALIGNASGTATASDGFSVPFDVPYYGLTLDPPPAGTVLRNRPGYSQSYDGVEVQLAKPLSGRWMLRGSFGYNDWKQRVEPAATFNPNDRVANDDGGVVTGVLSGPAVNSRWTFSVSGLYQGPWGLNFAGRFYGREGFPQTYFIVVRTFDTADSRPAILTAPVGQYRLDNVYELDLRLEKTLVLGPVSLIASLDAFNLANANAVLARRRRIGFYNARRDPAFVQDNLFNQIVQVQNPRILRAGVRVAF